MKFGRKDEVEVVDNESVIVENICVVYTAKVGEFGDSE